MRRSFSVSLIVLLLTCFYSFAGEKRVKVSHKVEKTTREGKKNNISQKDGAQQHGREVVMTESADSLSSELKKIRFAGYEKEPNSSVESFIVMNPGSLRILGFDIRINYLDMQGRMFHSRDVELKCDIPPGESRRFDISSWDRQHTYYYYLGNKPKKVATPFKVEFIPKSFQIESDNE